MTKQLSNLLRTNEDCPELERLERAELCIDTEERDTLVQQADKRCSEIRAQVDKENLARELIRERLVDEFWKPMDAAGATADSLRSRLSVANYPERKVHADENELLARLQQFRDVENCEKEWQVRTGHHKQVGFF